ncbi:hypothetical protein OTU49_016121 [Cherax quadricarinatus]|uniref:Testin n=2 Tax=Cherax quadricarinatus TaxID=27406 RepID=A0AAW0YDQ8_CHEQU
MSEEVGSVRPNPYIFDIENRRKRKPRLAHDLGAGAKCNKCGDKCPGFELHFWRKICMNCRCGKDDHEVEDDDEDIGRIVIGKLFDRPPRTRKEELEYCHGNHLDIVNEETGKTEKLKFDWVPPNVEKSLAARYMALLPPEKRPLAGSQAAKERRRQLEQQLPLYDMDEAQRCDNMPAEELQCFHAYLERIRTQIAGQGLVQEIPGAPVKSVAHPWHTQQSAKNAVQGSGKDAENNENIGYYPESTGNSSLYGVAPKDHIIRNKNLPHVDDHTYSQPVRCAGMQPDNRSSLRDQFMGAMIGDYGSTVSFTGGSIANSEKYAVAPQTSKLIRGLSTDQPLDNISADLSNLNINRNQTTGAARQGAVFGSDNIPGQQYMEQDQQSDIPSQYNNNIQGNQALTPGQQGYRTGQQDYMPNQERMKKGHLPLQKGYMPNIEGYKNISDQQVYTPIKENTIHGYHMGASEPGQYGLVPGQETCVLDKQSLTPGHMPGTQGLVPGQEGYMHGKQGVIGQEAYVPDIQGFAPGQESCVSDKPGLTSSPVGHVPGKQGLVPGQDGYVPGQQGLNPPQEGSMFAKQQLYTLTKESIPVYQIGASEPTNQVFGQETGIPHMGSIGSIQGVTPNQGRVPQQLMNAKNGNITSVEAVQAPYGARLDTMAGGMSLAPGTDVTVLFPGESQVLGSNKNSIAVQKSKLSCQYCSLPMNVGDVAIFCERAGLDKCWHPACFCCYTCKELLADLIYFYKDGKVFCGRHFTDAADMPRCKSCDELIFGNSWTRADGFDWHIHHFCCNVCDTPMAGQRYVPDKDGYPYCLPCYMACLAKMCETCEEKIPPEENRCGHRGYFYHANPQCFRCYSCKDPLLGKRFKMSKNWLFCSNECIQAAAEDLAVNPNPKEKPQ